METWKSWTKTWIVVATFTLPVLPACSSHSSSPQAAQATEVPPLAPATQVQVGQNLNNNRLPSPSEVENNSVPTADEACENFRSSLPAAFPNLHYTDFPGTGHDASYNEPAAWADWINQSAQ
jgi:hypothetical protein